MARDKAAGNEKMKRKLYEKEQTANFRSSCATCRTG